MEIKSNYFKAQIIAMMTLVLIACDNENKMEIPGYIEGKYSYISAGYDGILNDLYVSPGQKVTKNQPLFSLNPRPESDEITITQARIEQAKSEKSKFDSEYQFQKTILDRKTGLYKKKVISKEEFDSAKAKYEEAVSRLSTANKNILVQDAQLNKLKWITKQKISLAPAAAIVFDTFYTQGEFVPGRNPVVSLLLPASLKIIFYSDELELSKLKLNQQIEVRCDNCAQAFKAKLSYISPKAEYTPPVIYSAEVRATLTYRIEALPIDSKTLTNLHPGQPVTIKLGIE
jgi:HlyD family secretion protein